jgi:hypothetical protein
MIYTCQNFKTPAQASFSAYHCPSINVLRCQTLFLAINIILNREATLARVNKDADNFKSREYVPAIHIHLQQWKERIVKLDTIALKSFIPQFRALTSPGKSRRGMCSSLLSDIYSLARIQSLQ